MYADWVLRVADKSVRVPRNGRQSRDALNGSAQEAVRGECESDRVVSCDQACVPRRAWGWERVSRACY